MGRMAMTLVLSLVVSAGVASRNLSNVNSQAVTTVVYAYDVLQARNNAESGLRVAMGELFASPDWRAGFAGYPIGEGTFDVSIVPDSSGLSSYYWVNVSGHAGAQNRGVRALLNIQQVPAGTRAAVTAEADINIACMDITTKVDGRDYPMEGGAPAGGMGMPAASSAGDVTYGFIGYIYGTLPGRTYTGSSGILNPAKVDSVLEESLDWGPDAFPDTPAEALGGPAFGYTDAGLLTLAQSGVNGSQYVTDPATLTFPLSGVTYVELPDAGVWNGASLQDSRGILVVHNGDGNAMLQGTFSGSLKGILVTDRMDAEITTYGSVIVIGDAALGPVTVRQNSKLQFSLEAILAALGNAYDVTRISVLAFQD